MIVRRVSLLHVAARLNAAECVRALLECKSIDVNQVTEPYLRTPLSDAVCVAAASTMPSDRNLLSHMWPTRRIGFVKKRCVYFLKTRVF